MDRLAQEPRSGAIPAQDGVSPVPVLNAQPAGEEVTVRKPNYRFERAERDRLKRAKKEEKARRQQERAGQPASDEPEPAPAAAPDTAASSG